MTEWVHIERRGRVLDIELTRPGAINAIDAGMIAAIREALESTPIDEVDVVVFRGEGQRGFSAGGDVRQAYQHVVHGHVERAEEYFTREYELNALIAEYPRTTVALMHGVCMGGGVGLAGHTDIRLVTDGSRVAMPETKIGFTPDVGGSWLLARAEGRLGERLGLHGQSMGPAEAIEAGFADLYISAERWPHVRKTIDAAVATGTDVAEALAALSETPGTPDFGLARSVIDEVYSQESVSLIIESLERIAPEDAAELRSLSPTSLEVTLRSIRASRHHSLRAALAQELRLVVWMLTHTTDTLEGIRALLVDKDRNPHWQPLAEKLPI